MNTELKYVWQIFTEAKGEMGDVSFVGHCIYLKENETKNREYLKILS
jgi:hypothetical protein